MNQNKAFVKEFCDTCDGPDGNFCGNCNFGSEYEQTKEEISKVADLSMYEERFLVIDAEQLRKYDQLKDEENFIWTIKEIFNQRMEPKALKIVCFDLMATKFIYVDQLCDYELVGE